MAMAYADTSVVEHAAAQPSQSSIPLSEIALTGIYEISKILNAPNRLETTLSSVLNVLSSFLQMRHGVISLLADDDVPDITVGIGWNEGTDERYRARLPETAIGQIVATAVPLVVEDVSTHPLFTTDAVALGAADDVRVSFIGVPIRIGTKVIGTMTIDRIWDGRSVFRLDSDVRFLTMIANLIGQTVQLYRVVSRDRDRLMAESHRLQKELSELKPVRERKKGAHQGHHRRQPGTPLPARQDHDRRQIQFHRAAARGIRHRQGVDRQGDPRTVAARQGPVRQDQLCGAARIGSRIRTVRP